MSDKDPREGRFVPMASLQEERAEKKQLREELRQYREWQAQLARRLRGLPVTENEVLAFNPAAPSPATPEAEEDAVQSAVNLVCNHLNEHSRELGGAGMIAEAQDYAHAAALVRRYFGDKK